MPRPPPRHSTSPSRAAITASTSTSSGMVIRSPPDSWSPGSTDRSSAASGRSPAGSFCAAMAAMHGVSRRARARQGCEFHWHPPRQARRASGRSGPRGPRFAADAVLVAHNAAFDITFLYRAAEEVLSFDQPVVDTLLLSAHLFPTEADHSLDAIAARLGLEVVERHSALRDSLLTAAILLRLLDRCEERGITRLGQLVAATDMAGQLRAHR